MKIVKFFGIIIIATVLTVASFYMGAQSQTLIIQEEVNLLKKNVRKEAILQIQLLCELQEGFYIDKELYFCFNTDSINSESDTHVTLPKEYTI